MLKNSKEELEEIFVKYYEDILKYCMSRMKNNLSYAEDINNEVFIVLCKKWDSLGKQNIRAWLYRVADNLLKEFFRKQKKLLKTRYIEDLSNNSDYFSYEENFEDISDEEVENYKNIILGNLSEDERKLFSMHFADKKTYIEICGEFSISEDTLKKRIYRLKKKILTIIEKTTA